MIVKELKKILSHFNDDDEVVVAYDNGDYWGSVLTKKITDVDYQTLNRNTGKLITPDKIDNYDRDDLKENIVVIQ